MKTANHGRQCFDCKRQADRRRTQRERQAIRVEGRRGPASFITVFLHCSHLWPSLSFLDTSLLLSAYLFFLLYLWFERCCWLGPVRWATSLMSACDTAGGGSEGCEAWTSPSPDKRKITSLTKPTKSLSPSKSLSIQQKIKTIKIIIIIISPY